MTRWARAICVVLVVPLLGATPATSPARRTRLETWITQLGDRDPVVRDMAKVKLMGLTSSELPLLRSCVVARRPRPAEADGLREAVVHVLTRQIVRALPTSATMPYIGVHHFPSVDPPPLDVNGRPIEPVGTEVQEVLPGSPAAALLRVGDVILGRDEPGRPTEWIVQGGQLAQWVTACPTGESLTFVVRRAGRILRVSISPEPRPLPPDGGFGEETITLADNAQDEANRVFDQEWAPLPGMTP